MAFQYNGGSMIQGAALQNQQQQTFFDQLARGLENYQFGRKMDLEKQKLASDPEVAASAGFMTLAQGGTPTPQQYAAMKWVDAQNQAKVTTDQYGNRITNQSYFDLLGASPQPSPSTPQAQGGFSFEQLAPPQTPAAPRITNKAEEMAYQQQLDVEKDKRKMSAELEKARAEQVPLITSMRQSLGEMQTALDEMPKSVKIGPMTIKDPQSGPVMGRLADLYNVPEYENFRGAQNTVALQARNLLQLPASGFSDADRNFLEQVAGGSYQWRDGTQRAIERINRMLQSEERRLGVNQKDKKQPQSSKQAPPPKPKITKEQALQILRQRGRIQ